MRTNQLMNGSERGSSCNRVQANMTTTKTRMTNVPDRMIAIKSFIEAYRQTPR